MHNILLATTPPVRNIRDGGREGEREGGRERFPKFPRSMEFKSRCSLHSECSGHYLKPGSVGTLRYQQLGERRGGMVVDPVGAPPPFPQHRCGQEAPVTSLLQLLQDSPVGQRAHGRG